MTETKHNICTLCSMGCGLLIEANDGLPLSLEYEADCPVSQGALCAKGNYALELLNHPFRLGEPTKNGSVIGWDAAIAELAQAPCSPKSGFIVEGNLSDEEARTVMEFACACARPENVAISFSTNDDKVVRALDNMPVPRASIDDLKSAVCTIAVNDPFSVGPVVARWVMRARNAARENTLNVIAASEGIISEFATVKLTGPVRPSLLGLLKKLIEIKGDSAPEWARAAADDIARLNVPEDEAGTDRLAREFLDARSGAIVLSTSDPVEARLAGGCCLVAGAAKKLFLVNEYGNASGISQNAAALGSVAGILRKAARGEIDALIVLGADLVASYPETDVAGALRKLRFLAAGAAFPNKTTALASVVLPTAIWLEKDGTFNGMPQRAVAPPPGGALPYGQILQMIECEADVKPAHVTATAEGPVELNREFMSYLVSEAAKPAPPAIIPSPTRFADGSVTDHLSWPQALAAGM